MTPTTPIPPDEYAELSRQARRIAGEQPGTSYAHHVIRLMNMVETERKTNDELREILSIIRGWKNATFVPIIDVWISSEFITRIDTALSKES